MFEAQAFGVEQRLDRSRRDLQGPVGLCEIQRVAGNAV